MKKPFLKLFLLGALTFGMVVTPTGDLVAKQSASTIGKVAKKKPTPKKKSNKRNLARKAVKKQNSLAVLRKYLPAYAAIYKTKSLNLNDAFVALPHNFDFRSPFVSPQLRVDLIRNIDKWLGTRYRYGGSSKRGVDCSSFTSAVMSETLNEGFRGTSRWQAQQFTPIFSIDSLQFGDMLFFAGRNRQSLRIGHVGIYLGNGVFAHSSTGKGVIYTHIFTGYYNERFRWGGRFVTAPVALLLKVGIYSHQ